MIPPRNHAALAALTASTAALSALGGCSGSSPRADGSSDNFDRPAMLAHVGGKILLPLQEAFATRAAAVPAAIETYCVDLAPASLDGARAAWRDAADAWQAADALLVGPAAMDHRTLRERIYAWPLLSTCGLDRDTARNFTDPGGYDVGAALPNVRSLASVEYLMFATATAHTCAASPPGWDALGAELPRARCRLAARIAADVAVQAAALRDAWLPSGGDYAGELARAGQSGSSIPSPHEGVNLVSDALFYADRMVKDMKLAEPAGLAINTCGAVQAPCLRELEHAYADRGTFAIRANLTALRQAFTGTAPNGVDGPAFEDFLRALDQGALADRMVAALDGAIAKAALLPDRLGVALSTDRNGDTAIDTVDYPEILAAHAALKLFTDDLKSQFLTVLSLKIPDDVATDND